MNKNVSYPVSLVLASLALVFPLSSVALASERDLDDGKLRIIVFGAHPDDCEIKAGGAAAMWAAQGHHVKFVSTTNGDIGHAEIAGGPLAKRRTAEVKEAAKILGIETEVLDNHDGEIMPTLENRKAFVPHSFENGKRTSLWDIVRTITIPNHRYTGVLMQDAAFMVTVAFYCPDVPQLPRNPVFLYLSDRFQKPNPFEPDLVAAIDDVFEQKFSAIWALESQIESLWATGNFERVVPVPKDPAGRAARRRAVRDRFARRSESVADKYRAKLIELYGKERGKKVRHAEAFEICEYGSQPSLDTLKKLFPFFGRDD